MPSIEFCFWILTVSLFGLVIGSFLNVCIYRIPREENIVFPSSHCTSCGHTLGALDLVPVFSFLFLQGKCRYCHNKISSRYMIIELTNALLYGTMVAFFGISVEMLFYCLFSSVLLVLAVIDFDHMLLPTRIIGFGALLGVIFRLTESIMYKDYMPLLYGLIAGAMGYVLFYTIFYVSKAVLKKEALGFGDVRYIAMIGIFLTPKLLLVTIFLSAVVGSIYGVIQLYINKESRLFPYGPFISIAAVMSLLFGERLINWYMNTFF